MLHKYEPLVALLHLKEAVHIQVFPLVLSFHQWTRMVYFADKLFSQGFLLDIKSRPNYNYRKLEVEREPKDHVAQLFHVTNQGSEV